MAETRSTSEKKKKIKVTSPTKSVKFSKVKTPSSDKKKFAKTPHSSKTPVASVSSPIVKKKRKLSFNNLDSSETEPTPIVSPKKPKKVPKKADLPTDENPKALVKKPKLKKGKPVAEILNVEEPKLVKKLKKQEPVAELSNTEEPKLVKKRKFEDGGDKPAKKKKKVISEEDILKEKRECTVFVGNLPTTITKEGITKAFSKFGKVRSARIRCIPLKKEAKNRKSGAILKQFSGQPAAAFVKFCTNEDAQKAVALNGTILDGHRIRVDLADPSKSRSTDKNKAIFLRNLHFQLTDDELWQAFEDCGEIESVRIIKDRKTYLGRGLGYVNFTTTDAVELALKKNESDIKGRSVKVQRCDYVSPKLEKKSKKNNQANEGKPKKDEKKVQENGVDFTGNKTQQKKKIKKKLTADGLKKKKIAQVLAAKS